MLAGDKEALDSLWQKLAKSLHCKEFRLKLSCTLEDTDFYRIKKKRFVWGVVHMNAVPLEPRDDPGSLELEL